ncbi:uncharacterized protein N7459_006486 [Penicillium hispanicum]|uniref:uncharacterized protein n=1 Tax=Penicillium hispanicum TaxID=1080232 RepID=UPI0025417789|nr:uncharacterized protein N7459_006486 [Penicillium hispanicum]KAJ5577522.1 hypothetical protein N7459_006486 [Penicillium hispanicum]
MDYINEAQLSYDLRYHAAVSLVSLSWDCESKEVQDRYKDLASIERHNHALALAAQRSQDSQIQSSKESPVIIARQIFHGRLSEQYDPEKNIKQWISRSREQRKTESSKLKFPSRPSYLYMEIYLPFVRQAYMQESNEIVRSILSLSWQRESDAVKDYYKQLLDQEKTVLTEGSPGSKNERKDEKSVLSPRSGDAPSPDISHNKSTPPLSKTHPGVKQNLNPVERKDRSSTKQQLPANQQRPFDNEWLATQLWPTNQQGPTNQQRPFDNEWPTTQPWPTNQQGPTNQQLPANQQGPTNQQWPFDNKWPLVACQSYSRVGTSEELAESLAFTEVEAPGY